MSNDFRKQKRQADGASVVALGGLIGKEVIYGSHNYCDPCVWYSESERVTDEALSDNSGTWESTDINWITMRGGRIMDEDAISQDQTIFDPGNPHGYRVKVIVDGVEKVEREPLLSSGGDYTVDYENGSVTPISEDWTGQTVLASYSKAVTAGWILKPLPGKALVVSKSEVQFSKDIAMTSAIVMEAYGDVAYFAPQLAVSNGGPIPDGTPIPLETTYYRTIDQLIDEAVASFPLIPPLSSGTNRGYQQDRVVFQFYYGATKGLFSSLGMFYKIGLSDPTTSLGGERATATFYCNSKTDGDPAKAMAEVTSE